MKFGPNTVNRIDPGANFSRVANIDIQRSLFDRSHRYMTTCNGGFLVPIFLDEALPGDSFDCDLGALARMTTPVVPFMDNVHCDMFFFSIPKRLLWDNFESFITGSDKGKLGTVHTTYPQVTINHMEDFAQSIYDYLGLVNPEAGKSYKVNALPLRAYNLVYNEWFRDENLMDSVNVSLGDTEDENQTYSLLKRGKRKDYFTSALPWPQKGVDVLLPLGQSAPVVGNGNILGFTQGENLITAFQSSSQGGYFNTISSAIPAGSTNFKGGSVPTNKALGVSTNKDNSGLVADLSNATSATINSIREAFAIQHVFERDARGGSRYVEALLSHFRVQSPDFRLQRPEFLGGGRIEFAVNSVAQTSATDANSPQGNLSAVAFAQGRANFRTSFVEHCIVLGVMCIYTDLTYQQGINRMWFRRSRFDEYWPEFSHLGEQPIYEGEIYAQGDLPNAEKESNIDLFGYQERYAEYRYKPSMITGKLRSTDPQSLDVWHLAQKFANAPSLSQDFIVENPPFERVLAVQNEPQFIVDLAFNLKCMRPLPMFGTPSLLDHF